MLAVIPANAGIHVLWLRRDAASRSAIRIRAFAGPTDRSHCVFAGTAERMHARPEPGDGPAEFHRSPGRDASGPTG